MIVAIASSPDPIQWAAVLGAVKARPGNAEGCLTDKVPAGLDSPPARAGCEIWRSGRKNARGAGRTKEWTREEDEKPDLRRIALAAVLSGIFFEQIELA